MTIATHTMQAKQLLDNLITKKTLTLHPCDYDRLIELYHPSSPLLPQESEEIEFILNAAHESSVPKEFKEESSELLEAYYTFNPTPTEANITKNKRYKLCLEFKSSELDIRKVLPRIEAKSDVPVSLPDLALCWAALTGTAYNFNALLTRKSADKNWQMPARTLLYAAAGGNRSILNKCFDSLKNHEDINDITNSAIEKANSFDTILFLLKSNPHARISTQGLVNALKFSPAELLYPLYIPTQELNVFLKNTLPEKTLLPLFTWGLAFIKDTLTKTSDSNLTKIAAIIFEETHLLYESSPLNKNELETLTNVLIRTAYALKAPFDSSNNNELAQLTQHMCNGRRHSKLKGALIAFCGALLLTASIFCCIATFGIGAPLAAVGLACAVTLLTSIPVGAAVTCSIALAAMGSFALAKGVKVANTGRLSEATSQFWQKLPAKKAGNKIAPEPLPNPLTP